MIAMVVAPIVMGVLLVGGTVGWFAVVRNTGDSATGARIEVQFEADCGAEAEKALLDRATMLGLAPKVVSPLRLSLATPGMPDDATHLPAALSAPGRLEVSVNGTAREIEIKDVGVQLAFSGTPVTLLLLSESLPEQGVTARFDGKDVEIEDVTSVELQIASRAGDSRTALRTATDRAMAVRYPLPCAVRVSGDSSTSR
jgi:hypothetical protein